MQHAILIFTFFGLPWYANTFTRSIFPQRANHHHRFVPMLSSENSFEPCDDSYHMCLRFSPLVGGPSFLPLHVELILIPVMEYNLNDWQQMQRSADKSTSGTNNENVGIHRFDFLPDNPRDRETIMKLMQFQSVPGNVRYRSCQTDQIIGCFQKPNQSDASAHTIIDLIMRSESINILEDRGMTIVLHFGTSPAYNKESVLSSAINFVDSYRSKEGKELRILGGKNCISFALDMISYLDEKHGIDFALSIPKIV